MLGIMAEVAMPLILRVLYGWKCKKVIAIKYY